MECDSKAYCEECANSSACAFLLEQAHAGNISTKRRTLRRFDSFLTPAYGSITLVCLSLCSQVRALNEEVPGSCKDLFRSWEDRLDLTKVCLPTDQFSHPILAAGTVL